MRNQGEDGTGNYEIDMGFFGRKQNFGGSGVKAVQQRPYPMADDCGLPFSSGLMNLCVMYIHIYTSLYILVISVETGEVEEISGIFVSFFCELVIMWPKEREFCNSVIVGKM